MPLKGGVAILAGGAPADLARVRPVLELIGEVHEIGPLGSGARLKLVANSMLGALTVAAAEGQKPERLSGSMQRRSSGRWPVSCHRSSSAVPGTSSGDTARRWFAVRDLRKDLDLALDMFTESGARALMTTVALQRLRRDVGVRWRRPRDHSGDLTLHQRATLTIGAAR